MLRPYQLSMAVTYHDWHRRSTRCKPWDYTSPGRYFVTVNAVGKACIFGDIVDGHMALNEFGRIVDDCWHDIPNHFSNVELDAFVVMPNHIHGIIGIKPRYGDHFVGAQQAAPLQKMFRLRSMDHTIPHSLSVIIRSFKSAAARRINIIRDEPGAKVWQRNFHDRIVRNPHQLRAFRSYIWNNPRNWSDDEPPGIVVPEAARGTRSFGCVSSERPRCILAANARTGSATSEAKNACRRENCHL